MPRPVARSKSAGSSAKPPRPGGPLPPAALPDLILAPAARGAAPSPAPGGAPWRDSTGAVCAYSYQQDGRHRIEVPDVAAFSFVPGGPTVTATAYPHVAADTIRFAYRRIVLPLALQAGGTEVLHASAVRLPGGVVAFCAARETGKSTLAYALSRRGYPLWADDEVAWQPAAAGFRTLILPFAIRLRPAPAAFFAATDADTPPAPRMEPAAAAPLAAVCVLTRTPPAGGPPVEIARLAPAAAFRAVLTHGQCFDLDNVAHKRATLEHYLALTAAVPVWDIRYPSGLAGLPAILDAILAAVG